MCYPSSNITYCIACLLCIGVILLNKFNSIQFYLVPNKQAKRTAFTTLAFAVDVGHADFELRRTYLHTLNRTRYLPIVATIAISSINRYRRFWQVSHDRTSGIFVSAPPDLVLYHSADLTLTAAPFDKYGRQRRHAVIIRK